MAAPPDGMSRQLREQNNAMTETDCLVEVAKK